MVIEKVLIPDIGDYQEVPIIEILAKVGERVSAESGLCTLESDKATMEVPSPKDGVIKKWLVKLGDKVSMGTAIVELEVSDIPSAPANVPPAPSPTPATPTNTALASNAAPAKTAPTMPPVAPSANPPALVAGARPHAGPSVRMLARELGVDLSKVSGSGAKGRILREDVSAFVKKSLSAGISGSATGSADGAGLGLIPWPKVDFAKFGAIEAKPLSRIKKISGANLHRNWVMIPHVTQHDEADVTELEGLRKALTKEAEKAGVKVTMLAFMVKAVASALKKYPEFNASLEGDQLILKKYFHIGVAVDTPDGLTVPVIRDCDQKGIFDISRDLAALSASARAGKLKPTDMQGGCFSISSLGGIGGHYFTPIINAPEVAILGVSRNRSHYVPNAEGKLEERLMLPLSLSYDHRVIDGAGAARFIAYLGAMLADMRRALL